MPKKQGATRKQHYVPAGYIGLFASPRGRQGQVFAYDAEKSRSWTASAESQALEWDLYNLEGSQPDSLEKLLGRIENELLPAMRRIERGERSRFDVLKVAAFAALQSVRGPEAIQQTQTRMEQVLHGVFTMALEDTTRFEAVARQLKVMSAGIDTSGWPSLDEMRDAFRSGEVRPAPSRGSAAAVTLATAKAAYEVLASRSNVLWLGEPMLVTSTHPVVIWGQGPGLALADIVMMAVAPNVLFMSMLAESNQRWLDAPPTMFEMFNQVLAVQSRRVFGTRDNVMRTVETLLKVV